MATVSPKMLSAIVIDSIASILIPHIRPKRSFGCIDTSIDLFYSSLPSNLAVHDSIVSHVAECFKPRNVVNDRSIYIALILVLK